MTNILNTVATGPLPPKDVGAGCNRVTSKKSMSAHRHSYRLHTESKARVHRHTTYTQDSEENIPHCYCW